VKQIAPGLDALQKKLFCSEAELSWNCSTTAFPAEPFAPGAHADFVCKYEQRCCGGPVYMQWDDNGAVAGFQGVAGFGSKSLHLCCGEQALDPESQKEAFCAGTTTYRAHDLDCDGIPNSVDPTPLGDKTGEEMEKILKGEESPDDLDNVLPSDNDSWE